MILRALVNFLYYFNGSKFRTSISNTDKYYAMIIEDSSTNELVSNNVIYYKSKKDINKLRMISKVNAMVYLMRKKISITTIPIENNNFKALCKMLNIDVIKNNDAINKELYKSNNVDVNKMRLFAVNNEQILQKFNQEVSKIIV